MSYLSYIVCKFRDTFMYFKGMTHNKYLGDRFEEWVVTHSNITRFPFNSTHEKAYWRLLEWRGDKCAFLDDDTCIHMDDVSSLLDSLRGVDDMPQNTDVQQKCKDKWYALSNLAPDLLLEGVRKGADYGKIIAVECKYRSKKNDFKFKDDQVLNYTSYIEKSPNKIAQLYYLFGFGWSARGPKELYLIPADELYTVNGGEVIWKFDQVDGANDIYDQYRVSLDGKRSRFIQNK